MNKTVKNEVAVVENKVTPVKKSRSKKTSTTAVAPVTTTAVVESKPVANKSIVNKLLSFDDVMQLLTDYHIGSKPTTKKIYRIINGESSLHVLQKFYRLYATDIDYQLCEPLNDKNNNDIEFKFNDNIGDNKRPHTILIYTTDMLKKVLSCINKNKLNAPC